MRFSYSGEVEKEFTSSLARACGKISAAIHTASAKEPLKSLDVELHFCPIVVSDRFSACFLERRNVARKTKTYHFSPRLDLNSFKSGSQEDQIRDCVTALKRAVDGIKELGGSDAQIQKFLITLEGEIS